MRIEDMRIDHELEKLIVDAFNEEYPAPRYTIPDGGEFEYESITGYYYVPVYDTQKDRLIWASCDPDVDKGDTFWWEMDGFDSSLRRLEIFLNNELYESVSGERDWLEVLKSVVENNPSCNVTASEIAITRKYFRSDNEIVLYTKSADEVISDIMRLRSAAKI